MNDDTLFSDRVPSAGTVLVPDNSSGAEEAIISDPPQVKGSRGGPEGKNTNKKRPEMYEAPRWLRPQRLPDGLIVGLLGPLGQQL